MVDIVPPIIFYFIETEQFPFGCEPLTADKEPCPYETPDTEDCLSVGCCFNASSTPVCYSPSVNKQGRKGLRDILASQPAYISNKTIKIL